MQSSEYEPETTSNLATRSPLQKQENNENKYVIRMKCACYKHPNQDLRVFSWNGRLKKLKNFTYLYLTNPYEFSIVFVVVIVVVLFCSWLHKKGNP